MNILAVESSCDETAVAIVRDGREVLCDCIASQVDLHKIYGGVVPEIASRKHIEAIYGLADQALAQTGLTRDEIDAVAVTYAPGLIGDPGASYPGPYCRQLYCLSRVEAPVPVSGCLWRSYYDHRSEGLYGYEHPGYHFG